MKRVRSIELGLNQFDELPASLKEPKSGKPVTKLSVLLKEIFRHYYIAKYGDSLLDGGHYEYERGLTDDEDWRFRGAGLGVDKEAKRNISNEMGKAFARWFLHQHFDFTYFAPLEDLIGVANRDGSKWQRVEEGDLPDYVCGKDRKDINLLEAKGRYRAVSFKAKGFDEFRKQIRRVRLLDSKRRSLEVKGYISVGRWATAVTPNVASRLLVEDPSTEGMPPDEQGYPQDFGLAMVAGTTRPSWRRFKSLSQRTRSVLGDRSAMTASSRR